MKAEFNHWKHHIRYTELEFILNNKDVKSLVGTKLPTKITHEQNGNKEAPESPSWEPGGIPDTLLCLRKPGLQAGAEVTQGSQLGLPCPTTLLLFPLSEVFLHTSAQLPSMVLACAVRGRTGRRKMEEMRLGLCSQCLWHNEDAHNKILTT